MIEDVPFVVLDLFKSLLCVGLLLAANFSLDNFITIKSLLRVLDLLFIDDFLLGNMNLLGLFIKRHVVEGLFKALDVDLEGLKHLIGRSASAVTLLVKLDCLLLKELLERCIGDLRVVRFSVSSDSSLHFCLIVVRASSVGLWEVGLNPQHQRGIVICVQQDD